MLDHNHMFAFVIVYRYPETNKSPVINKLITELISVLTTMLQNFEVHMMAPYNFVIMLLVGCLAQILALKAIEIFGEFMKYGGGE